jgi:hypothetical protein
MTIHPEFSEWFHQAGIQHSSEVLQMRWAGLQELEVQKVEVVPLTELFFGFFDGNEAFLAEFRESFRETDSSFRMRDNNREVSVLAGAALAYAMEGDSPALSDFVSLSILSCAAQNMRKPPCVRAIPERAATFLARRTVDRRKAETAAEDEDPLTDLRHELAVIGEECNILWWVIGETSRDTDKPWAECSTGECALLAGKELADLTRIIPGPAAARALLARVLTNGKSKPRQKIGIADAITSTPASWRGAFAKAGCPSVLRRVRPVARAIELSVEHGENDAWIALLRGSIQIDPAAKIPPYDLAYQFFMECMLAAEWLKPA